MSRSKAFREISTREDTSEPLNRCRLANSTFYVDFTFYALIFLNFPLLISSFPPFSNQPITWISDESGSDGIITFSKKKKRKPWFIRSVINIAQLSMTRRVVVAVLVTTLTFFLVYDRMAIDGMENETMKWIITKNTLSRSPSILTTIFRHQWFNDSAPSNLSSDFFCTFLHFDRNDWR